MNLLKKTIFCIGIFLVSLTNGYTAEYFVNSVTGNDQNPGTSANVPWKSLIPVQAKTFLPGDTVNFARGSSWTKAAPEYLLLIDDNGTPEHPIVFQAYGKGIKPEFSNVGTWNKGIKITAKNNIIDNLLVTNTGYQGMELAAGADYNIIRNCEITKCGCGINIQGSYNLVTKNYVHDMVMVVNDPKTVNPDNDFGATAFSLEKGNNNEISYNKAVTCKAPSYDYGNDGGFVEIWTGAANNYIHHNWVEDTEGFIEAGGSNSSQMVENNLISYNVSFNNSGFMALHTGGGTFDVTIVNLRIENNTIISVTDANRIFWISGLTAPGTVFSLKNNIIYTSVKISDFGSFVHTNNIYYSPNGSSVGFPLGVGDQSINPQFMDFAGKDFRLKANSPAIDKGIDLKYNNDFAGDTVPKGNAPDIGAYESDHTTANVDVLLNENNRDFSIFPNPVPVTPGSVNFDFTATQGQKIGIRILNIQGQTIGDYAYTAISNGKNLLQKDLIAPTGLYIATLVKGNEVSTQKFVIQ